MAYGELNIYNGMTKDNVVFDLNENTSPPIYDVNVYSGGKLTNTTLPGADSPFDDYTVDIKSGGVASNIYVSGGEFTVENGGSAYNIHWTPGYGEVEIENGATATFASNYSGVYLNSSGAFSHTDTMYDVELNTSYSPSGDYWNATYCNAYVMNGGKLTGSIANGAEVHVWSGGSVDDVTVLSNGELVVSQNASATNIEVMSGGFLEATSGSYVTGLEADGGSYIEFSIAPDTVFAGTSSGKKFNFSSIASDFDVSWGMEMEVLSGGSAVKVYACEGGTIDFYQGAYGSGVVVEDGGKIKMTVAPGTYVQGTIGGKSFVNSAGRLSDITIPDGDLEICSGGSASNIVLEDGDIDIYYGGTANGITLRAGDDAEISVGHGGVLFNGTAERGCYVDVENGGYANNLHIGSGAYLYVTDGTVVGLNAEKGATIYCTVNPYTCLQGTSAGRAVDINGGVINGLVIENNDDDYSDYGNLVLEYEGDCTYNNTFVNGAEWYVENRSYGDSTTNITIDNTVSNDGYIYLYNANANNTLLNNGSMYLGGGGSANNTTLEYAATLDVSYESVARNTVINNGTMVVDYDGTAENTSINNYYCSMTVDGGTARNTVVNNGSYLDVQYGEAYGTVGNDSYIDVNDSATDTTLNNGFMNVWGEAKNTTIEYAGTLTVGNDGMAENVKVNNGYLVVAEYGSAECINVYNSYCAVTNYGGSIDNIVFHAGNAYIEEGSVHRAVMNSGSYMKVGSDGSVENSVFNDSYLDVYGSAYSVTLNNGYTNVWSGAEINNFTAEYAATITLAQDGDAYNTTLNNGYLVVAGGNASASVVNNSYCAMTVYSGVADGITLNAGNLYVHGGWITGTTAEKAAYISVQSTGEINGTTINGGFMDVNGYAYATDMNGGFINVWGGAEIEDTTIDGGATVTVAAGGHAEDTSIEYGWMHLTNGATASNTSVENGTLYLKAGSTHSGELSFGENGKAVAEAGAVIDLDVNEHTASLDMSRVSGNVSYTLTEDVISSGTTHELAVGAENFTGTIALTVGGTLIGNLSANGAAIVSNGISYQLINNSGWLGLEVTNADSMLDEAVAESTSLIAADTASADGLYTGESLIYPADTALGAASIESLTSQDTDKSKFALIA